MLKHDEMAARPEPTTTTSDAEQPHGVAADAAQKATGSDRANDQPRQENTLADIVPEHDQQRKIEATLLAEFALKGHATYRLAEGGYLVCKHGHAKHCPDLRGLAAFARQVGVRS